MWLAWAAIAVVLTAGIVRWHVEYFRADGAVLAVEAVQALRNIPAAARRSGGGVRRRAWRCHYRRVAAEGWSERLTSDSTRQTFAGITGYGMVGTLLRPPYATLTGTT